MEGQDWSPVVLSKGRRGAGESKDAAIARAARSGALASEKKVDGGANRSAHAASAPAAHMRKLEEDTDTFAHATVSVDLRLAIQQARLAKKLTQKDLAAQIAEKPTLINDYEAGRAIPNGNILSKLERALDVRLPRPAKKK